MEQENRRKTEWAIETEKRLSAALARKCEELAETVRLLDQAEATVIERTALGAGSGPELQDANAKLQMVASRAG